MYTMAQSCTYRQPMPSNNLEAYSKAPPKELLGHYPTQQFKKAGECTKNTIIVDSVWDPANMQMSSVGVVEGGLNDSVGFVNTTTATKDAQKQGLDEDTLDVWNRDRQNIMECVRKRQALENTPFSSEAPDQWGTTYQREHVNLLPAVVRDTTDHITRDSQVRKVNGKVPKPGASDVYAADQVHQRTNYAMQARERDEASNDLKALKASLAQEKTVGVFRSRGGREVKSEGVPLNCTLHRDAINPHVRPLETTSHAVHGKIDRSMYDNPDQLPGLVMTADEEEYVRSKMSAVRNTGMYCTTNSDNFVDKTPYYGDVDTRYRKAHHFDKKHNVGQMPRHEPARNPHNLQNTKRTCDIVPGQYTTVSMTNNAHFNRTV